jgi:hypothetical protein
MIVRFMCGVVLVLVVSGKTGGASQPTYWELSVAESHLSLNKA